MPHSHSAELAGVVSDVDSWWSELEGSSEWLQGTERALSEEKPLASSVDILHNQESKIKVSQTVPVTLYIA